MKFVVSILLLLLVGACTSDRSLLVGEPVSVQRIRADVQWLSDDAREGRFPGTPGAEAASEYLARRFAELHLNRAPGMESYFQPFEFPQRSLIHGSRSATGPSTRRAFESSTLPTSTPASMSSTPSVVQTIHARNVIGVLSGSGPLKDEYIVVGAHYDHIGRGLVSDQTVGSGPIFNGADDNASGTAMVLAVAEALSGRRLNRSVILVCFSAEELGLLGSHYFVQHPPVPLNRIVAMINLDMVGRTRQNTLFVGGRGTRSDFHTILTQLDEQSPLQLKSIGEGGLGPSDHQSFALKKIPVLFFFTGLHPQYHHPDDDADRINYDAMAQIVWLITQLVHQIDSAPRQNYVDQFDSTGMKLDDPSNPSTRDSVRNGAFLGVIPDYASDQSQDGVLLAGTVPGSPASTSGLTSGDRLVAWNDKPLANLYDLTRVLRQSHPDQEIKIDFIREGKQLSVRVKLALRNRE